MSPAQRFLTIIAFLLLGFARPSHAQTTTTWTGTVSTNWTDARNWDKGVPTATSVVRIYNAPYAPVINTSAVATSVNIYTGSLVINPIGTLTISNVQGYAIYNAGIFDNYGKVDIGNATNRTNANAGIYNIYELNNRPGAIINIDYVKAGIYNGGKTISNEGAITIGASSTVPDMFTGTNLFANKTGGILKGTGRVGYNQIRHQGGILMPGAPIGILTLTTPYFVNAIVTMEVQGAGTAGIQYDQLSFNNANGTAELGGTLNLTISYQPQNGDQITIVNGGYTGTFTSVTGLASGWKLLYQPGKVVIAYAAQGTYWNGKVNRDWNNAGNWTSGVPGASSDVVIQATTNKPQIKTGTALSKSLTIEAGGQLEITSTGTLTINRPEKVAFLNNGRVDNYGALVIGSVYNSIYTGLQNNNYFSNEAGGKVVIDGIRGSNIGALFNKTGATFFNLGQVAIGFNSPCGDIGLLNNGSFQNIRGAQVTIDQVYLRGILSNATFFNQGRIAIGGKAGGNTLQWGMSVEQSFTNNGGDIQVNRAAVAFQVLDKGALFNAGKMTIGDLTDVPELLNGVGTGMFTNGTGGTLQYKGNIDAARSSLTGGAIAPGFPVGKVTFTGNEDLSRNILQIDVRGVAVAGVDFDQVVVNGTAVIGGSLALSIDTTVDMYTPVTIISATGLSGTFASVTGLPAGWKLTYTSTAVILVPVDNRYYWSGRVTTSWNSPTNWSKLKVPGVTESVLFPSTGVTRELILSSAVTIANMEISSGRTVTISATRKLTVTRQLINKGTINGTGVLVNADFTNNGTVAPGLSAGMLSIEGKFTNVGTVAVEVGGTVAGSQYDQLSISGDVTLAGNLMITTINGFKLLAGQSFLIIKGKTVTGKFASVTWPAGVTGTVTYTSTGVLLQVIAVQALRQMSVSSTEPKAIGQSTQTQDETVGKGGLLLAPVPATNFVNIIVKDPSLAGQHAQVYNMAGNLLQDVVLTGTIRMDITRWPAGTYIVRTKTDTYRLVKK